MMNSDAVLEMAMNLQAAGRPFALVTVVRCESPTSAKPGAKAVVDADGVIHGWIGGGCAQPAVIKTARQALADGQPRLIRISPEHHEVSEAGVTEFGMVCHSGGTLDIFIDPVVARPALLIIGASPAAQSLCALASRTGFSVTCASPGADRELFPDAVQVMDGPELTGLDAAAPRFVVVATQGKRDEPGLEAALGSGAGYIAFIASERKAGKLRQYLKERGHDSDRVDAIVSPAGLEIGAVTPEEIALSVLAGLVQARRSGSSVETGTARPDAATETPLMEPAMTAAGQESPAEAIDPVCGMSVEIETSEYNTRYAGTRYYFCCAHCQHSFEKEPHKYLEAGAEARS